MVKSEDIEYAIDQTILVHPEFLGKISADFAKQITDTINLKCFTRQNGAREKVENLTSDDLIRYFLNETIKIVSSANYFYYNDPSMSKIENINEKAETFNRAFPNYSDLINITEIIANQDINSCLHFKSNKNDLLAMIVAVINTRFKPNTPHRKYVDSTYTKADISFGGKSKEELRQKINEDMAKVSGAKKIRVNYASINKCLGDLMSGVQLKNQRNDYALDGDLYASQDVGKYKKNQEDCVMLYTHPENPNFKFLAVADGMGGSDYGEKASKYLTLQLTSWFQSLSPDLYYFPFELQKNFNEVIAKASTEIYKLYNQDYNRIVSGSTFVGALVADEQTIISSVGDSRAYISKDSGLELITQDESKVWPEGYLPNQISESALDDLRFRRENNIITKCIGRPIAEENIQTHLVNNKDYDKLLLFSDGVTDILSTDRINFLSLNAPPEELTKCLVNEALNNDAIRLQGEDEEYVDSLPGGKDNTTAAAYFRR